MVGAALICAFIAMVAALVAARRGKGVRDKVDRLTNQFGDIVAAVDALKKGLTDVTQGKAAIDQHQLTLDIFVALQQIGALWLPQARGILAKNESPTGDNGAEPPYGDPRDEGARDVAVVDPTRIGPNTNGSGLNPAPLGPIAMPGPTSLALLNEPPPEVIEPQQPDPEEGPEYPEVEVIETGLNTDDTQGLLLFAATYQAHTGDTGERQQVPAPNAEQSPE
jgi:hypothetical protein